jgi:hypothetical protein
MKLHRVFTDAEPRRNFAVAVTIGDERQHIVLTRRERFHEFLDLRLGIALAHSGGQPRCAGRWAEHDRVDRGGNAHLAVVDLTSQSGAYDFECRIGTHPQAQGVEVIGRQAHKEHAQRCAHPSSLALAP